MLPIVSTQLENRADLGALKLLPKDQRLNSLGKITHKPSHVSVPIKKRKAANGKLSKMRCIHLTQGWAII